MLTLPWRRKVNRTHRPATGRGNARPRQLALEPLGDRVLPSGNVITGWNEELLKSLAVNAAPVPSTRNMALVQVAMFDAVNAIDRSYEPYAAEVHASSGASLTGAAAQAGPDTLSRLYP